MRSIPDYSSWSRNDLLNETTKLQLKRSELAGNASALDDHLKARLAALDAQYHAAYLALFELSDSNRPVDAGAARRRESTKAWHRGERDRNLAIALGTERLVEHGAELQAVST